MRHPSRSRVTRGARGQITWVTLVLLAAVVGGGYMGWVYVPVWVTHYQAKHVVRTYMNYAVKRRDDEVLKREMVRKLRALQTVEVRDEAGEPVEVPAVNVDVDDVLWERDAEGEPPTLHVQLEYVYPVVYPLLERQEDQVMEIDFTGDLTIPRW